MEGLAWGAVERGAQLDRILRLELPVVSRYTQRICGAVETGAADVGEKAEQESCADAGKGDVSVSDGMEGVLEYLR